MLLKKQFLLFGYVTMVLMPICYAQLPIGQAEVNSFGRVTYSAGTQNWSILQDKANRMYFANNEGLLVYDGTNWQTYPVPNNTILRSICFGPGNKLYAGAQDEFGYYAPDTFGNLKFTSLKPLLPSQHQNFTDIWEIEEADGAVYFRSNEKMFVYAGGKAGVISAKNSWVSVHKHQQKVVAHDPKNGLFTLQKGKATLLIPFQNLPANIAITDMVSFATDTTLVSTMAHGFFLLTGNQLIPYSLSKTGNLSNLHFTCVTLLHDSSMLVGTYQNGVYRVKRNGEIISNISSKNGLPNNTVRAIYADKAGNAWVAMDNGIAFFDYYNAIHHINPTAFNNGSGYDVKVFNNSLYFALSTGIFQIPLNISSGVNDFKGVPFNVKSGLSWNLSIIHNKLLAGRDDGLYLINPSLAPIKQSTGFWNSKPLDGPMSTQFAAGNYTGITLFSINDNLISEVETIKKFAESSRYFETDDQFIWVSHPYRGVYKINRTSKETVLLTQKEGLPNNLDNHVFKIKGKVVFATVNGIYEYNATQQKMVKAADYDSLFGNLPIRYLKEDELGNIWFVQNKMIGVADYSGTKPVKNYIPELTNKVLSGFENIYPYGPGKVLIGGEDGFYHIDYKKYLEKIAPITPYITLVKTFGTYDTVLYGGFSFSGAELKNENKIPYYLNSIHIAFASSIYGQPGTVEYSYFLKGFDKVWSSWSRNTIKEYTNLPAGTYEFMLKSRNGPSQQSGEYVYSFTVKPPWYKTTWAYILFTLLFASCLYALFKYQARQYLKQEEAKQRDAQLKFEAEKQQTAYQHQLELEQSEKEFIRLKNEKLENDIVHKNTELATATMHLVEKKEFILKLKNELRNFQKTHNVGEDNIELKRLIKILSAEENLDDEWESFSQHFTNVHGAFLKQLKKKHPTIKPHELRLCAYLRMNLSSKDIAPLMSISIRGVEISRYRLRKKLGVATEVNLVQYLMDLENEV